MRNVLRCSSPQPFMERAMCKDTLVILHGVVSPESADSGRALGGGGRDWCRPQKALRGGIPWSFLEPLGRSWSRLVGIYRQKSIRSLKN